MFLKLHILFTSSCGVVCAVWFDVVLVCVCVCGVVLCGVCLFGVWLVYIWCV